VITDPDRLRTVEMARNGDRKAFCRLVEDYAGFVHALVRRTTGDPDAAEDVCQEVFVKAWLNIALLKEAASFPSWIASIARRASVDHARKAPAREILEGEGIEDRGFSPEPFTPPSGILERALSALTERDRDLLTMVYFHEMSHAEVGGLLGLPEKNIRVYLLRARRRLRSLLEGRENELVQQISRGA
jgi:RNA polymerase sigma-70 factor, ECF subfamily